MVGAALYGRPSFPRRGVPTECKGSFIGHKDPPTFVCSSCSLVAVSFGRSRTVI